MRLLWTIVLRCFTFWFTVCRIPPSLSCSWQLIYELWVKNKDPHIRWNAKLKHDFYYVFFFRVPLTQKKPQASPCFRAFHRRAVLNFWLYKTHKKETALITIGKKQQKKWATSSAERPTGNTTEVLSFGTMTERPKVHSFSELILEGLPLGKHTYLHAPDVWLAIVDCKVPALLDNRN